MSLVDSQSPVLLEKVVELINKKVPAPQAHLVNGTRVAIPAGRFIKFIDSQGIRGRFCLQVDENQKFVDLRRV